MVGVLSVILVLAGIALVAMVLLQSGKSHGLSGSIAGGAETFFGKTKGKKMDGILNKATTILAIGFVALLLVVYFVQPDYENVQRPDSGIGNSQYYEAEDTSKDTTEDTAQDTSADSSADTSADTSADSTSDTSVQ